MKITAEEVRQKFRPDRITTLFVGESAPFGGTFFYYGNGNLGRYLKRAVDEVFVGDGDFLERFKAFGWYLDDLVLSPVNHLKQKERKAMRFAAKSGLTGRIADYRPLALVCLMQGIGEIVQAAAREAGFCHSVFVVPFPGNGQQARFHRAIVEIMPTLPRARMAGAHEPSRPPFLGMDDDRQE